MDCYSYGAAQPVAAYSYGRSYTSVALGNLQFLLLGGFIHPSPWQICTFLLIRCSLFVGSCTATAGVNKRYSSHRPYCSVAIQAPNARQSLFIRRSPHPSSAALPLARLQAAIPVPHAIHPLSPKTDAPGLPRCVKFHDSTASTYYSAVVLNTLRCHFALRRPTWRPCEAVRYSSVVSSKAMLFSVRTCTLFLSCFLTNADATFSSARLHAVIPGSYAIHPSSPAKRCSFQRARVRYSSLVSSQMPMPLFL